MMKNKWLAMCGLLAVFTAQGKPINVVFILADDLGITDIAAYASHYTGKPVDELYYETPHLDRLMGEGLSFSQHYANQLCSPTRAAIMSGQYAARNGFTTATPKRETYYNQGMETPEGCCPHDVLEHKDNIKQQQAWLNGKTNTALDPALPTLPKVLKGHRSAFIGKWHLGGHGAEGFQPLDHGFDEVPAWQDAGASGYFKWYKHWNSKKLPYPDMPQKESAMGSAGPPPYAEYLTDDLTDRAVHFIEQAAADQRKGKDRRPFFLYLNHFAVHTPLQAPEKTVAHFENKPQKGTLGHDQAVYAAMVKHLDDSVGRILQTLEKNGLNENTLVVFTSDNGGVEYTKPAATDNFPFKGGKACLHEGGVRVPLIYRMPGKIRGGVWCDTPVNCIDQLPTLAELTGNRIPKGIDGISLVPLLKNPEAETQPRTFYWHYPFNVIVKHPDNGLPLTPHSGIRSGDYKLLWDWHGKLSLYDIAKDPYEANDLSQSMPEKRDQLIKQLKAWLKENVAPQYFPVPNPDYNEGKDIRPYPFMDLSDGAAPSKPAPQTFARFVPERADDFAWENDKVAFRVYGPAMRSRPEDSGIDCWLKRVDYPVIDRWYLGNVNRKSYHRDHGEGYDPYHVGRSRGCGGLGLWIDGKMVTSNTYTDWKIIKSEPEETVFVLTYEWKHGGDAYKEEKRIGITMGDRFFRVVSTFWKNGIPADGLPLAVGVTTHDGKAAVEKDVAAGWLACWESIDGFGLGTGVMLDPAKIQKFKQIHSQKKDESHALFITFTDRAGRLAYRAGYGWEKAGEIRTSRDWNAYLSDHADKR